MAPKRRIPSDSKVTPEPNKRVTRSSTRGAASPTTPDVASKTSQRRKPETKSSNNPKRKVVKEVAEKKDADCINSDPESTTTAYTTLTIPSDLTKNPVQCHEYTTSQHPKSSPTLIFTHGAGGTLSAPAVVHFCTGYASAQPILAFQGSMNLGARVKGFHACYAHLHNESDNAKPSADAELVFGGRSMGARAAVMAASEITGQSAGGGKTTVRLVLVSYPLVGPKGELRDQILLDLAAGVQVLFVSGDRDAMCPLDRLEEVMRKMTAKSQLLVVKGADHGMKTRPAGAEKEVGEESGRVAAKWVQGNVRDEVLFIGE